LAAAFDIKEYLDVEEYLRFMEQGHQVLLNKKREQRSWEPQPESTKTLTDEHCFPNSEEILSSSIAEAAELGCKHLKTNSMKAFLYGDTRHEVIHILSLES
jgi:hypothetical protein